MDNDDLLDFAGYLGLKGQDQDLFYESYYGIENEEPIEICSVLGRTASVTRETFMVCSSLDGIFIFFKTALE